MNIQVQICGLVVVVLLYVFYLSQRTLKLFRERLFINVMRSAIMALCFDILSIVGIHYRDALPTVLVHLLCKAYLLAILASNFSALFYLLPDIMERDPLHKLFLRLSVVMAVACLSVLVCPIDVYEEGRVVYSLGPAVILTYVYTIAFILTNLFLAATRLRRVNRRRATAVILWMCGWMLAAAIQFLHNELLLVGFACALGMVVLYVMLEAPESYQDKQFACFNSYAFDIYCSDMRRYKKKFSLLEIRLLDEEVPKSFRFHPIQTPAKVISMMKQEKGVFIFKNADNSVFAVSEKTEKLKKVYKLCSDFVAPFGIQNCVEYLLIEDSGVFENSVDLSGLLTYSGRLSTERAGELVTVSNALIKGYAEEDNIANEIRNALKEDRIEVFYQPIYSLHSASFETAEALVRMRGRDGRLVSPSAFIPVAEKRGLIVELGERIFEKVCQFISEDNPVGFGVHYLEVNLSVVQCERAELAEKLTHIMNSYHISPDKLNFELTETGAIKAKLPLLENMSRLCEHGATFSLDDFGKGQSNLIYLIEMPVSILKMDYELTKSYHVNEKARHIICSVVELAHSLGLKVVAEGIETEQELTAIRETGVDYIQGYYFSRPMPKDDYLTFIRSHNGSGKEAVTA